MRVFVALLFAILAGVSHAQEAKDQRAFEAPKTETGEAFTEQAKRGLQRVDAEYLSKDADPKLAAKKEATKTNPNTLPDLSTTRSLATIVLIAIVVALVVLWLNNRTGGGLFARQAAEGRIADADGEETALMRADAAGEVSLKDLAKIEDPREGLRALLLQALVRAARQNDIALRRSLTTRDVFRRVPRDWQPRPVLKALIDRAELVLFGGRSITVEEYETAVAMAQPIFSKGGKSKGGRA